MQTNPQHKKRPRKHIIVPPFRIERTDGEEESGEFEDAAGGEEGGEGVGEDEEG